MNRLVVTHSSHTRCETGSLEAICPHFFWLNHGWRAAGCIFKMRCAFSLSCYSTSLWGSLNVPPLPPNWGWTESSISLELTKTGASGEKLECNGSSVSHRVHASRKTQQSCQGSTPPTSVCFTLVPIWIDPMRFLFPPSSITKLHTHLPPPAPPLVWPLVVWP